MTIYRAFETRRIEKGTNNLTISTISALAKGLGVHPKELLDFEIE